MRISTVWLFVIGLLLYSEVVRAQCSVGAGPELVVNGDFDLGMVGISSDVIQGPVICCDDRWELGTNANLLHGGFTGTGSPTPMFLVCNGPTSVKRVWFQTVAVSTGTDYVFGARICNVLATSADFIDPILRLTINGVPVTASVVVPEVPDIWVPICANWNSGGSTTALLAVESLSLAASGNDLGIDSISFRRETILAQAEPPHLMAEFESPSHIRLVLGFPDIGGQFEVENSADGLQFGMVANGPVEAQEMEVRMANPLLGRYWRLKWEDAYGDVSYSPIITLDEVENQVIVAPHPVRSGEMLRISGAVGEVRLSNPLGQSFIVPLRDDAIDTHGLDGGMYLLSGFTVAGKPFVVRVVVVGE